MLTYNFYNKNDAEASEIAPIFSISNKFRQSPMLQIRILALLEATYNGARNVDERHLSLGSLSDYFQGIGCSEAAIDMSVNRLLDRNLVEPFDPSNRSLAAVQKLAISHSGRAHLRLAMNNQVFFEQFALTTEISDADVARMISAAHDAKLPRLEKFASIRTLFAQYLLDQDEREMAIPKEGATYETQRQLTELIRGYTTAATDYAQVGNPPLSSDVQDHDQKNIYEAVLGTVDFYDRQRGFGFVDVNEIGERCYVGADAVSASGVGSLNDGDDILCDIGPSLKGPVVTSIHDIQVKPEEVILVECVVVRLEPRKYYGFVSVFGHDDDALFHFSLLSEEQIRLLEIGQRFKAEIRTNSKNGRQQVRRIDEIINI